MCTLGNFVKEEIVSEDSPLIGFRNWLVPIKEDKVLKSLNQKYVWPFDKASLEVNTEISSDNLVGIYNNNNNNNYYNYNYDNYNYNYNNNYNNYYNNYYYYYNYHNYNYNYHNYNYYDYNLAGRSKSWGKIIHHDKGHRSEFCRSEILVVLDKDSEWFSDPETEGFANHFNNLIEEIAKLYEAEIQEWSKFNEENK